MTKIIKYSYVLFIFLPLAGYFIVLNYYTPDSLEVVYKLECNDNNECRFKTDNQHIEETSQWVKEQIAEASRMSEFSKPFSGFIRFHPRVTNMSSLEFIVSSPAQSIKQNASVTCELTEDQRYIFSHNSGIYFGNKTSLSEVPDMTKMIVDQLNSCIRGVHTESDFSVEVGPGGTVAMKTNKVSFNLEYIPDDISRVLIALEMLAISLALLPITREGVRFLAKGWRYFY